MPDLPPEKPLPKFPSPVRNLYVVCRTYDYSTANGMKPPCDEAFLGETIDVDLRVFKTPEEFRERIGEDWFARGTNHRTWPRGICRDIGYRKQWLVTVEDMQAFVRKYGKCTVIQNFFDGFFELKIGDE